MEIAASRWNLLSITFISSFFSDGGWWLQPWTWKRLLVPPSATSKSKKKIPESIPDIFILVSDDYKLELGWWLIISFHFQEGFLSYTLG